MFDVCANRKIEPQTEADAKFMVQELQAGNPNFVKMFNDYQLELRQKDNYPATAEPYLTDNRTLMSALYCNDHNIPKDVTITTPAADVAPNKRIDFSIDVWKPSINLIYEGTKGHPVTPELINIANQRLKTDVPPEDRARAAAQYNQRARADHQPMEVILDSKSGDLKFQASQSKMEASK
jgi:hypothetical protein